MTYSTHCDGMYLIAFPTESRGSFGLPAVPAEAHADSRASSGAAADNRRENILERCIMNFAGLEAENIESSF